VGRPLFVAAGGGGDAIGAWLVARTLGVEDRPAILTWSWDRLIVDPVPGPRNPDDFAGLEAYGNGVYRVPPTATVRSPANSTLPRVAAELDADLFLLDARGGTRGVHEQIMALIDYLDAPGLTVVDVGGDIMARGDEPELLSPFADALVLAAAQGVPVPIGLIVAGPGLDGELSEATLLAALRQEGGGQSGTITAELAAEVAGMFTWHPSEATGLLCAAAQGMRGRVLMRGAGIPVDLTDNSPTMWVVGPWPAFRHNQVAQALMEASTFDNAERTARTLLGQSELDIERAKAAVRDVPAAVESSLSEVVEQATRNKVTFWSRRYLRERLQVDDPTLRDLLDQAGLEQASPPLVRVPARPRQ